jgi:membrane-associated phospholipid phosphatase
MVVALLATLASVLFLISMGATYNAKRYYRLLPTLARYPDCETEAKKVAKLMQSRTPEDVLLFQETNEDGVGPAFIRQFPECARALKRYPSSWLAGTTTLWLKILFNRPRPCQLDASIKSEPSISARTPSFPSGHAMEAYLAARVVSKHFPHKEEQAMALAEACANARVIAGLHYPSDGTYAKKLANAIPDWLIM